MDTKYTTDGKKVVVIGKLNAQETIVQEIFVIGESEIPSGEHFVTKSLHDAPAVSWKEKKIKEIDATLASKETRLEELRQKTDRAIAVLSSKLNMIEQTAKNINEDAFRMASDVMAGRIKYVVKGSYSIGLMTFEEFEESIRQANDYGRFEGFRLLSLYGKYSPEGYTLQDWESPKGNLAWQLHSYSDGSGGRNPVYLFVEKADALAKVKELVEAASSAQYSEDHVKILRSLDLPLDSEKLAKFEASRLSSAQAVLKEAEERFQKAKEALAKVQS